MVTLPATISVVLAVFLGLVLASGDAYEMVINHSPQWAYNSDVNSVENSYQFYYPYYQQQHNTRNSYRWNYPTRDQVRKKKIDNNRWKHQFFNQDRKKDNFRWNNYPSSVDFNRIKMPTIPPVRKAEMSSREWPAYHLLPPIRMIELPLDEPPQP